MCDSLFVDSNWVLKSCSLTCSELSNEHSQWRWLCPKVFNTLIISIHYIVSRFSSTMEDTSFAFPMCMHIHIFAYIYNKTVRMCFLVSCDPHRHFSRQNNNHCLQCLPARLGIWINFQNMNYLNSHLMLNWEQVFFFFTITPVFLNNTALLTSYFRK